LALAVTEDLKPRSLLGRAAKALGWRLRHLARRGEGLFGATYRGRREAGRGTVYEARWRMTLREWLAYHQKTICYDQSSWLGVKALKNPLDLWMYQEILFRVRPEVLVEIGSFEGGSTLYYAHLFDLMGGGEVLSLDLDHSRFAPRHPRITCLTGDASSPEILARVKERCAGRRVLVIHDGDHRRAAVRREMELYAPLVPVGSYLIVEDGILDLYPPDDYFTWIEEGPLPAILDFVRDHPEFEIDESAERYVATYNPRGFLKRVR
jgi:cephalosporin hydroxylase